MPRKPQGSFGRDVNAGVKIVPGKPVTPVPLWSLRPSESLALGSDQKGHALCQEHAKQNFGFRPRTPGLPIWD